MTKLRTRDLSYLSHELSRSKSVARRFLLWDEIEEAVKQATAYWNAHRYLYRWGTRRKQRKSQRPSGIASVPTVASP